MPIVLVVDDVPGARYSMVRPLAAAGFDIRETASGRDALRLARVQPAVIILDIVVHDMDGFDVLHQLKSDRVTKDIPVVLKTAVHEGIVSRASPDVPLSCLVIESLADTDIIPYQEAELSIQRDGRGPSLAGRRRARHCTAGCAVTTTLRCSLRNR